MENFEEISCLRCPVTSLSFVDRFLICGEGSHLKIYELQNKQLIATCKAFEFSRIHIIKYLGTKKSDNNETHYTILLLGGKCASLVDFCVLQGDNRALHTKVTHKTHTRQFPDWLWDGHFNNDHQPTNLLRKLFLLSAHNVIWEWDWNHDVIKRISACVEQCILYSGHFFHGVNNNLIVAAGTVFNQILLWQPIRNASNENEDDMSTIDVWKKLHGHEGVIFSIRTSSNGSKLLSVSDDRSIRMWDIESSSCLHVLYGHAARVWRAVFLRDHIVSVGEDAHCIIWNDKGSVEKKLKGHQGKSIWSLAVHEELGIIATGGGDCSIRLWDPLCGSDGQSESCLISTRNIVESKAIEGAKKKSTAEPDHPRTVAFLSDTELIAVTNDGCLKICSFSQCAKDEERVFEWFVILRDGTFGSYCAVTVCREERLIVMGNLAGMVKCIFIGTENWSQTNCMDEKLFDGKIHNIFVDRSCHCPVQDGCMVLRVITSGPDGRISISKLTHTGNTMVLQRMQICQLPFSRQRWVTAAALYCNRCLVFEIKDCMTETPQEHKERHFKNKFTMVCGDRRGSLHVFQVGTQLQEPIQSLIGLHGKTGVTCLRKDGAYLYSTGRDGAYQKMRMDSTGTLQPLDRRKACKGMDWIEGLHLVGSDIWIYGFYMQAYFGIWSVTRNELILKIQCGGGYRSWDLISSDKGQGQIMHFAYLKGSEVNLSKVFLSTEDRNCILQDSLHGREITCIKVMKGLPMKDTLKTLLITGSEDTVVKFHLYDSLSNSLESIHSLQGHIGGVKAICAIQVKDRTDGNCGISRVTTETTKIQIAYSRLHSSVLENNDHLLFSCGSRTSLKCWRFNVSAHPHNDRLLDQKQTTGGNSDLDIECHLLSEIGSTSDILKRKRRHDLLSDLDDLRYLAVDVVHLREIRLDLPTSCSQVVIATACSDGFVRVYGYDYVEKKFSLIISSGFHHRCVLSVKLHIINPSCTERRHLVMASAGTDGRIALWNIANSVVQFSFSHDNEASREERSLLTGDSDGMEDSDHVEETIQTKVSRAKENFTSGSALNASSPISKIADEPLLVLHAHQSGINDLAIISSESENNMMILSGGDDNCISAYQVYTNYTAADGLTLTLARSWRNTDAHISSVTGVKWLASYLLCSCSIDQRIKIWELSDFTTSQTPHQLNEDSRSTSDVLEVACMKTDVADVSSIDYYESSSEIKIVVSGIGLEVLTIPKHWLTNTRSEMPSKTQKHDP